MKKSDWGIPPYNESPTIVRRCLGYYSSPAAAANRLQLRPDSSTARPQALFGVVLNQFEHVVQITIL